MKKLESDWFFKNMVDFEYQQYILLDYIQKAREEYNKNKLYPAFADLIFHYNNLKDYKENFLKIKSSFPKEIEKVDHENKKIIYQQKEETNSELVQEIEKIINFSIPKLKEGIDEGKKIYNFVQKQTKFDVIGIEPLYRNEGYLLIRKNKKIHIFRYSLFIQEKNIFDQIEGVVNTRKVNEMQSSLLNNVEKIKKELTKNYPELPNPATYFFDVNIDYPLEETILPIMKNKFLYNTNIIT